MPLVSERSYGETKRGSRLTRFVVVLLAVILGLLMFGVIREWIVGPSLTARSINVNVIGESEGATFRVDLDRDVVEVTDAANTPNFMVVDGRVLIDPSTLSFDAGSEWISIPADAVLPIPERLSADAVLVAFGHLPIDRCVLPDGDADWLVKLAVEQHFEQGADRTFYDLCPRKVNGGAFVDGRSVRASVDRIRPSTIPVPSSVKVEDMGNLGDEVIAEVNSWFHSS